MLLHLLCFNGNNLKIDLFKVLNSLLFFNIEFEFQINPFKVPENMNEIH